MYYKFGIEFDIITRRCQRMKYHAGISPVLSSECLPALHDKRNIMSDPGKKFSANYVCALWSHILVLILEGRVQLQSATKPN